MGIMPKMTYALQDGILKHVSEVASGLACKCICPSCQSKLIARKGRKKVGHFAHYNKEECSTGYETTIHLLAKDILINEKVLKLPKLEMPFENYSSGLIANAQLITLDKVILEKRLDSIIPDVVIESKGQQLIIEIFVTHKINDQKRLIIQKLGISTLEIDLSKIHTEITYEELRHILINNIDNKGWVYNKAQERCRKNLRKLSLRYKVESHGLATHIMGCPINKRRWKEISYANLIDDCFHCKYLFERHDYEEFEGDDHEPYVLCTGECGVSNYVQYKDYMSKYSKK